MCSKDDDHSVIYDWLKPVAQQLKIASQMLIGAGIFVFIGLKLIHAVQPDQAYFGVLLDILKDDTLKMVGKGLALSAGVELAYMLFTPGPDEALEPVILGMAAAILIVISEDQKLHENILVVPLLALSMGILFVIRRVFVERKKADAKGAQGE